MASVVLYLLYGDAQGVRQLAFHPAAGNACLAEQSGRIGKGFDFCNACRWAVSPECWKTRSLQARPDHEALARNSSTALSGTWAIPFTIT